MNSAVPQKSTPFLRINSLPPQDTMKTAVFNSITTAFLLSTAAAQSVPATISYQGIVTDSNGQGLGTGTPVNRKVIFRIFDDANAGNRLWTEEHTATLANGEFSVLLGSGIDATGTAAAESRPSLVSVLGSGSGHFLEITVDNGDNTINNSDVPITPRQRIAASAFALRAATADSVAAGETLQLNGSPNDGLGHGTFGGTNYGGPVLFGASGGALGTKNGATESAALAWDSDGDVGIGVTAPSEKLDVAGNIKASGNVSAGGNLSVTGNISGTGTISVNGDATFGGNANVSGDLRGTRILPGTSGIVMPGGFGPRAAYQGSPGNSINFAQAGVSEDTLSYKNQVFHFRDSEGGGDSTEPSVDIGGSLTVGGAISGASLSTTGAISGTSLSTTGNVGIGTSSPTQALDVKGVINLYDGATKNFSAGLDTEFGGQIVNFGTNNSRFGSTLNPARQGGFFRVDIRDNLGVDLFQLVGTSPGSSAESIVVSVDHAGNIKSKSKPVPVVEDNTPTRIVRGSFNVDAHQLATSDVVGSGFSAGRLTLQTPLRHGWRVNFSTAFSGVPVVTATYMNPNNSYSDDRLFVAIQNVTASYVDFRIIGDGGGEFANNFGLSFIAIGPR